MIQALLRKSRKNAGTLADCMIAWAGADTPEAKVSIVRIAETLNLIHSALTRKT